jgi:hypothetical protein
VDDGIEKAAYSRWLKKTAEALSSKEYADA